MKHAILLLAALVLVGCSSVPMPSLLALSRLDIRTVDAGELSFAIQLPEIVDVAEGSASATLRLVRFNGEAREEVFFLKRTDAGAALPQRDGFRSSIYRISPQDLARFADTQATLQSWEVDDGDMASGSLGIDARPCRTAPGEITRIPLSSFIRVSDAGDFLPLMRDLDLLQQEGAEDLLGVLPDC